MTVIASTLSLLTNIFVMFVSSDVANGACQHASRDHQMHLRNMIAFYASPMEDHALKDTIYQVRKASADVVCAIHCLQDESCKSFNYCNDKVCQLKAANNSINGSDIQLSAGCRHYGDKELLETEGKDTKCDEISSLILIPYCLLFCVFLSFKKALN